MRSQATNPTQNQINAVVNLYRSGKMTKAEQSCRKLLKTYPQSLVTINVLGAVLQEQGKLKQAVELFAKAIQLKPDYAVGYYNRGVVLQGLKRLDDAVNSYDKAIHLKPDYEDAYSNRGNALKDLGQLERAIKSYGEAIRIRPNYTEAYNNRGNALKDLGRFKEAVESYNQAIKLKPDYAEAYVNRGLALKALGDLEKALENYDMAIQLSPSLAEAYSNRGVALKDLGQLQDSLESYNKAIQLKPDYAEAYINRGNVLTKIGDIEKALESYDSAIQIAPDLADGYSNYGVALRELGQLDDAAKFMQMAVEKEPENSNASDLLIELLNYHLPDVENRDPYAMVQERLQQVRIEDIGAHKITDEYVRKLHEQCERIIADHNVEIKTNYSQLYRGAIVDMNCQHHKVVFDRFNIIPEYCFDCYKVTVSPRTVVELFKLFFLFDSLKLPNDNTRKCIVEVRPEISGTYKGFIYCRSLSEAKEILNTIREIVDEKISVEIPIVIKRGCSEYEISYPDYGDIADDITKMMTYNREWRDHEIEADNNFILHADHNPNDFTFNHSGLTLLDVLVMCNWLRYAEETNDLSYLNISGSYGDCMADSLLRIIKARSKA